MTVAVQGSKVPPAIQKWVPQIDKVAYRGFDGERVLAAFLTAAVSTPALFKCDPKSIGLAMLKTARWGLDIGDGVYLVPYKGKCEAIPSYQGLKALAYRQGICRLIQEYPVYEGDHFKMVEGVPGTVEHERAAPEKRGKLEGAWIKITLPGGLAAWHHMFLADIEKIRKTSHSWNPSKVPECPPWYAMKTVVRNWLSKQPKSGAIREAMASDDAVHEGGTAFDPETGEVFSGGDVPEAEWTDLPEEDAP